MAGIEVKDPDLFQREKGDSLAGNKTGHGKQSCSLDARQRLPGIFTKEKDITTTSQETLTNLPTS